MGLKNHGHYGRIREYNARSEKWENYLDRLEEYFIANDIQNEQRKRAILNSTVGPETFKLICDLLAPTKPKDSTYDDIVSKLKGVLHPWALFLKTLCIFSKNKATSDEVSYGSGQKCSKELKNHSFISVETIFVKLQ